MMRALLLANIGWTDQHQGAVLAACAAVTLLALYLVPA